MTGATVALLVGGGLAAAGGAVYLLRKKQAAANDPCAKLGELDPRAAAICRFVGPASKVLGGAADAIFDSPVGDFVSGVAGAVGTVVHGITDAFSGGSDAEKRHICEGIRDDGRYGLIDYDEDAPEVKAWCAKVGVTW